MSEPDPYLLGYRRVERSDEQVERARQFVADRRLTNVDVVHGDARSTGLPEGTFDLATARLVLVNVPQPEQLVAEMVRLVWGGDFCARGMKCGFD